MLAKTRRSIAIAMLLGAIAVAMLAAPSTSVAFTGHSCKKSTCQFFTSSYHTAKYFYNRKTCDQWKDLSNQYLHGFKSRKALKRRFDRKQHRPC